MSPFQKKKKNNKVKKYKNQLDKSFIEISKATFGEDDIHDMLTL
jgi:hypothetical protein